MSISEHGPHAAAWPAPGEDTQALAVDASTGEVDGLPDDGSGFESSPGALALDAEIADALGLLRAGLDALLAVGDRGDFLALGPRRLIGVLRAVVTVAVLVVALAPDPVRTAGRVVARLRRRTAQPDEPPRISTPICSASSTRSAWSSDCEE